MRSGQQRNMCINYMYARTKCILPGCVWVSCLLPVFRRGLLYRTMALPSSLLKSPRDLDVSFEKNSFYRVHSLARWPVTATGVPHSVESPRIRRNMCVSGTSQEESPSEECKFNGRSFVRVLGPKARGAGDRWKLAFCFFAWKLPYLP